MNPARHFPEIDGSEVKDCHLPREEAEVAGMTSAIKPHAGDTTDRKVLHSDDRG
jgi:hypothetical protein